MGRLLSKFTPLFFLIVSFYLYPVPAFGITLINGGVVSDSIAVSREQDSHTFAATAGESIQLRVADTSGDSFFAPGIDLYSPSGTLLTSTWNGNAAGIKCHQGSVTCQLTETGTYSVVVSQGNPNNLAPTGPYNLYFVRLPGASEGGALPNGSSVSDSIDIGDLDSYTFAATAGESIQLRVADTSGDSFFAPGIDLYSPSGTLLTSTWGPNEAIIICSDASSSCRLLEDGLYTVVVSQGNPNTLYPTGSYSIAFTLDIDIFSYAALGDSFSSGEGVLPYMDPSETPFSGCHRSIFAYSTNILTPDNPEPLANRPNAKFDFLACSGAVTKNVSSSGEGQYGKPPQLASINGVNASRDLITMTIGGNDALFVPILIFCFAHPACNEIKPFSPHSDFTLTDLFPLWVGVVGTRLLDLYSELKDATPNAATLILNYPILVGGQECPATQVPFFEDIQISASEQSWLREGNEQLNTAIKVATAAVGLHHVSVVDHFEGHGVCGPLDDWINGLVPSFNFKSSFHPTQRGQLEYSKVANAYLKQNETGWSFGYLPNGLPRNPPPLLPFQGSQHVSNGTLEGPLPQFGELTVRLGSAPLGCEEASNLVVPGELAAISGTGFAPEEPITLSLVVGEETFPLGVIMADASGNLETTVSIPPNLTVGKIGSFEALSAGFDGVGLLLFSLVRVEDAITVDTDGDGIPDGCDNCSAVSNADQSDMDLDGAGDVCDACPQESTSDEDGDGICASEDNCTIVANPDQRDTDGDNHGNMCDADLDNNGIVNTFDLAKFKSVFGSADADADLDGNGVVNTFDLARFKALFGQPPGPSATTPSP
ncbi:MAG: thrombospondin type 3 repeat-containing protein [Nitrospira sp.]|nr:thrombospondin type 3 repeat-containing protein [Nitrospira sp.]